MRTAGTTPLPDSATATYATLDARQVTLRGEPVSVPAARRFVRDVLGGAPRADDLAQAVTELAANAVAWSAAGEGGTFTVTVRTAPRWARVEVTDPGPTARPRPGGNGLGLGIVTAVTDRSGTCHGPGGVRTAWAEVTWPDLSPVVGAITVPASDPGAVQAITVGCAPALNHHDSRRDEPVTLDYLRLHWGTVYTFDAAADGVTAVSGHPWNRSLTADAPAELLTLIRRHYQLAPRGQQSST